MNIHNESAHLNLANPLLEGDLLRVALLLRLDLENGKGNNENDTFQSCDMIQISNYV